MLSTQQYEYLKSFLQKQYELGNKNYVCTVNYQTGSSSNYYELDCYLSADIENNGYTFSFPGETTRCRIDTTSGYNSQNLEKLNCSNYTSNSVSFSGYDYLYSSVGKYPDIIQDYRTSLNNHLDLNSYWLIPFLLLLMIMNNFIFGLMKKR